ncbi:MAG: hypothetical protein J6K15_11885 [Lachnospiraceae bacterium]|nr:hypothetical protein [Lachnospiraceae bacterium]MBP3578800.1 hypothetical protein [Lachnospiraceae bacterium]
MAYYSSPKAMYEEKAAKAKKTADVHYAKAMNGEGDYHFGKAKTYYKSAGDFSEKAKNASSDPWPKKK